MYSEGKEDGLGHAMIQKLFIFSLSLNSEEI